MGNTISFKNELGLIIVSGLIFLASFLWKDFLTDIEEFLFPKNAWGLGARFIYTLIVTIIIVIFAVYIKNLFELSSSNKSATLFDDSPLNKDNDDDSQNIQ